MEKTKLYIATHKRINTPKFSIYEPIALGNNKQELPYLKDDVGENIADKNLYYSELTALYWIWKNGLKEQTGFLHYHRYFYKEDFISEIEIQDQLKLYDWIVPKPIFLYKDVFSQYKRAHHVEDLILACEEILKQDRTYKTAIEKVLNQKKFYMGNLFITQMENIENYLSFLFPILFNLEKQIPYLTYSVYNQRVFGFLAERIFNIYLQKHDFILCEYPVLDTFTTKEKILHKIKNKVNSKK